MENKIFESRIRIWIFFSGPDCLGVDMVGQVLPGGVRGR
jgi:hypothetical protein